MLQNNGGASGLSDESPVDRVDEQLVAYLDGELEPEDRKQLEVQLGRNPALRARLRTLQEGWELLDELPMATPSPVLLESTLRMAAIEVTTYGNAQNNSKRGRLGAIARWLRPHTLSLVVLALIGFMLGAAAVRINDRLRFENQLAQLPIALDVDAYLHGSDLELIRALMQMPQWQEAIAIAEQLGEWNMKLQQTISLATPEDRQRILPQLPVEDQQEVTEAWQRFERLGEQEKRTVLSVAAQVENQSDAEQLLATMRRFAAWRQSLPPSQRDLIASEDPQQRRAAIAEAIQRTTQQWTQQTARRLSDDDFEMIYQALRHIAQRRIMTLDLEEADLSDKAFATLQTLAANEQAVDLWHESIFLRRLFEPRQPAPQSGPPTVPAVKEGPGAPADAAGRGNRDSQGAAVTAPSPPPPGPDFLPPMIRELLPLLDQIQGPLDDEELWMIESVLSRENAMFIAAAATIEGFREEILRSWAEDAIRRMMFRRRGATPSERYELLDETRRDQLDLQPPEQILDWLRDDGRRRRPFP